MGKPKEWTTHHQKLTKLYAHVNANQKGGDFSSLRASVTLKSDDKDNGLNKDNCPAFPIRIRQYANQRKIAWI